MSENNSLVSEISNNIEERLAIAPIVLLETIKNQVYNEDATKILLKAFEQNKPLVILVVADIMGIGRSTWLNSLIYEFTRMQNGSSRLGRFKTGNDSILITNG